MKQFLSVILIVCVLLAACGKTEPPLSETELSEEAVIAAPAIEVNSERTESAPSTSTNTGTEPSEPLNPPPDDLTDEELCLWNNIAQLTDKPIIYYDIADYEGNGKLVMFAAANYAPSAGNFDLWYTDGTTTELLDDTKIFVDYSPLQFGSHRYFLSNQWNRSGTTELYGVKDDEWYLAFQSGGNICMGNKEYDEGEIIITTPADGLSWIYYWFFYDAQTRDFKEYGGVQITLEQFMTLKNADEMIEYGNGYRLSSIIYRGNGAINLIFNDESPYADYMSVTARYYDNELIFESIHDTAHKLACYPSIAVYPDITELFN